MVRTVIFHTLIIILSQTLHLIHQVSIRHATKIYPLPAPVPTTGYVYSHIPATPSSPTSAQGVLFRLL